MRAPAITPLQRQLALLAAILGWMFDGLEMGIFPLIARPALQQMQGTVTDDAYVGHWMGIITALFLLGAAAGGVLFGWLGDRIGRIHALCGSILIYSVFTGLVYFAQTPAQLGGLRFVAALGMGGEWSLGVALVMEIWTGASRPLLAGVIGAAGNAGFLLSSLVGLMANVTTSSWRWVALVGAAPALLTFFIRLWVPESPSWQESTAQAKAAPLTEIFSPTLWKRTVVATALCGITLLVTWGLVQWLPSWADKLTNGEIHSAKAWTQFWSAFGAIVGCLFGAWLGKVCGRRLAYFLLCVASLTACQLMFNFESQYGTAFLAFTFLVGGLTAAFYGLIPLYLPELFPTRARATAQGLAYNAGRVLAAGGALQMGALMGYFHGDYARAGAVISLIYVAGLIVIWFAPETKGQPLPE